MKNAFIYAGGPREEIEEQKEALRKFANKHGYSVISEFSDLGHNKENKLIMLERLNTEKHIDAILVKNMARLTRNIIESINLGNKGIEIITMQGESSNKDMIRYLKELAST